MKRFIAIALMGLLAAALGGCVDPADTATDPSTDNQSGAAELSGDSTAGDNQPGDDPAEESADVPASKITTAEELEAAFREKNPGYQGGMQTGPGPDGGLGVVVINDPAVRDIGPLKGLPLKGLDVSLCHISDIDAIKGMPLAQLFLEGTAVTDISVVKGMPLETLYLGNTRVEDLSALEGMKTLKQLYLMNTKVKDLGPLKDTQLESIWLNGTPVSDIGPLKTVPLVSLTLVDTKVADLTPLEGNMTLQRLHLGTTDVTDLTPLKGLNLQRLIITPSRIKQGLDVIREMNSLTELDVMFPRPRGQRPMPPAQFWQLHDAGQFE